MLPKAIENAGAQVTVDGTALRVETASFNETPDVAFFFLSTPAGRGICMAGISLARVKEVARAVGRACVAALGTASSNDSAGGEGKAGAAATSARPSRMPGGTPPAHAGNWAKVEGVYFRSEQSVGVGACSS